MYQLLLVIYYSLPKIVYASVVLLRENGGSKELLESLEGGQLRAVVGSVKPTATQGLEETLFNSPGHGCHLIS
jgi:hypothetical protein